ncbi:killer cell lectin-like receptor 3 [Acomys russatus]|uniref:killer cell lectin-like receptor 3 n=1 Tax=Acomys russatus TaxID=60746 RepID=UPI0021E1D9A7|nr:killer cell lectin-like receptor 3 [Acomys russatus]
MPDHLEPCWKPQLSIPSGHHTNRFCQRVSQLQTSAAAAAALVREHPRSSGVQETLDCCSIKCYYFIMGKKHWRGCKQTCQDCCFSLLKIDDHNELKLLQFGISPNNYWIGLSYDMKNSEWTWTGDDPSTLCPLLLLLFRDMDIRHFNFKDGACVFLSKTRLENISCDRAYHCICEKRLDKFPDSLSNRS